MPADSAPSPAETNNNTTPAARCYRYDRPNNIVAPPTVVDRVMMLCVFVTKPFTYVFRVPNAIIVPSCFMWTCGHESVSTVFLVTARAFHETVTGRGWKMKNL
jgi:hypothetical protein